MKKTFLTIAIAVLGYWCYAQSYLPLTAGSGVPLTGTLVTAVEGTNQVALNNPATNWGFISNPSTDVWSLGYGPSVSTLGTPVLTWNVSGNVGVGNTASLHKLEVSGSTGGRGIMGNGSTRQWYEIYPYEIATDNNAGWTGTMIGVRTGGMNSSSIPVTQNVTANAGQYQQAWAMTFGTDKYQTNGSAFSVWTGDATNPGTPMSEIFRIKSNGNVGVGTTNPDQPLTVNGTIHSKEVKVDLSVPVPDYVFEPAYKLPKLSELKAYVDQNHHLPEIPSAEQMAKDGLNLGDMNTRLLKKVEELTLYLIQQKEETDKQNKAQQEQINELKSRLAKLIK